MSVDLSTKNLGSDLTEAGPPKDTLSLSSAQPISTQLCFSIAAALNSKLSTQLLLLIMTHFTMGNSACKDDLRDFCLAIFTSSHASNRF